ncbi:MAG: isocitrate/isopropylmalate dehydrogenase family protein, partial [Candidatus Omnitrophica bacterium]|nr:isocitrate/isopropylmalate dehydrogenase family protein [Candidatus Omnitrophota bacterium]
PKYKGKNKVNPAAMILSAVMMLRHIGEVKKAAILEDSVAKVIEKGRKVTYDLKENRDDKSSVGTREMADAIISEIKRKI